MPVATIVPTPIMANASALSGRCSLPSRSTRSLLMDVSCTVRRRSAVRYSFLGIRCTSRKELSGAPQFSSNLDMG